MPYGAGSDPKVVIADDSVRAADSSQSMFEPRVRPARVQVIADDRCGSYRFFDKPQPLGSPFPPFGPKVEFTNCDIGNNDKAILNMGPVKAGSGVPLPKEEGENIGIEKDFVHGCRLRLPEPIDFGKHLVYIFIVRDDTREDSDISDWSHALFTS